MALETTLTMTRHLQTCLATLLLLHNLIALQLVVMTSPLGEAAVVVVVVVVAVMATVVNRAPVVEATATRYAKLHYALCMCLHNSCCLACAG
jgi:hypothetical protein